MVKQVLIPLIYLVGLSGIQVTSALTCYSCTDKSGGDDYDPACGDYYYNGTTTVTSNDYGYTCAITIHNNGHISRGNYNSIWQHDGDCRYMTMTFTQCFCKGDYCNTNSYCSQCRYPKPTPGPTESTTLTTTQPTTPTTEATILDTTEPTPPTTEATTLTTTQPTTPTTEATTLTTTEPTTPTTEATTLTTTEPPTTEDTTLTTSEPATPTTEATTLTTSEPPTTKATTLTSSEPATTDATTLTTAEPPGNLKCYQCIDCPIVDASTPVLADDYVSCVITVLLNSVMVIRGGEFEGHLHPDGECVQHEQTLSCWCLSDLCNDHVIDF